MKRVFIMRHGEASAMAPRDSERPLTTFGQQQVELMVQTDQQDLSCVDAIWASPYVRAQETAKIVSDYLSKPIKTKPWLTPGSNDLDFAEALRETDTTILAVSHQPFVNILINSYCGLEPGRYRMDTASIALLQYEHFTYGMAELLWLHHPRS